MDVHEVVAECACERERGPIEQRQRHNGSIESKWAQVRPFINPLSIRSAGNRFLANHAGRSAVIACFSGTFAGRADERSRSRIDWKIT
jgi:hypothetical protein